MEKKPSPMAEYLVEYKINFTVCGMYLVLTFSMITVLQHLLGLIGHDS